MAETLTLAKALNMGLRKAMEDDPKVLHHGRGRRQARRRLPDHRRPAEGLRRGPGHRHPAGRVRHRRHRGRPGACAATGRSARSSSTASSTRRTTRSSRQVAKMHYRSQGKLHDADRHPDPVRRRHRRGRAPQRVARRRSSRTPPGLKVVACSNPVDALLDDPAGDRLRRPGRSSSSPSGATGRRPRSTTTRRRPTRCSPRGSSGRAPTSPCWPTARW